MTSRPGAAAALGAAIGLVHDALSGGLYGLHGFAGTLVGFVMARMARLVDLQKSYYVALYFACAVLLQQLVLQGLLLLLTQQPECRRSARSPAARRARRPGRRAAGRRQRARWARRSAAGEASRGDLPGVTAVMDSQVRLRLLVQRTWQSAALLGVAFTVVAVGYWYTQIVRGGYYRELAENNRLRELKIEAPRGVILDREGRPLVENVPSYFLLLDRGRSESLGRASPSCARTLDRPPEELERSSPPPRPAPPTCRW